MHVLKAQLQQPLTLQQQLLSLQLVATQLSQAASSEAAAVLWLSSACQESALHAAFLSLRS
jgi:hypothetical protein